MAAPETIFDESSLVVVAPGVRVGKRLVTVAQMMQFTDDGGYQDSSLWLTFGYRIAAGGPRWMDKGVRNYHRRPLSNLSDPDSPALPIYWDEALAFTKWASRNSGMNVDLPSFDALAYGYKDRKIESQVAEWTGIIEDGFHVSDQRRNSPSREPSVYEHVWVESEPFRIRTTHGWDFRHSATIEGASIGFRVAIPRSIVAPDIRLIDITPQLIHWLRQDPARLSELSPSTFETFVANRLETMGMGVKLLSRPNRKDGGIDLIAWPARTTSLPFLLAGQVKHHSSRRRVGVSTVRDILGLASHAPFNAGLVVTNTDFSIDAKFLAEQHKNLIRLRGFNDLVRWLRGECDPVVEWRELPSQLELAPGLVIDLGEVSGNMT